MNENLYGKGLVEHLIPIQENFNKEREECLTKHKDNPQKLVEEWIKIWIRYGYFNYEEGV